MTHEQPKSIEEIKIELQKSIERMKKMIEMLKQAPSTQNIEQQIEAKKKLLHEMEGELEKLDNQS